VTILNILIVEISFCGKNNVLWTILKLGITEKHISQIEFAQNIKSIQNSRFHENFQKLILFPSIRFKKLWEWEAAKFGLFEWKIEFENLSIEDNDNLKNWLNKKYLLVINKCEKPEKLMILEKRN
jgi:hypothetical protein